MMRLQQEECSLIEETDTGGLYECNICFDTATYPVLTFCGHLYCWPCLAFWIKTLKVQEQKVTCPVCKRECDDTKEIIPIYGRGEEESEQEKNINMISLPNRPKGQRPKVITYATYNRSHYNHNEEFGEIFTEFRIGSRNIIIVLSSSEHRILPTFRLIHSQYYQETSSSSICIETGKMGFIFRLTLLIISLYVIVMLFY
ncbi:uncharacterized protein BX663DRAFT_502416 [Cokeromyces recurvatus]|uniref:uncharacterized protein n=1 Tax=Cokeromyces recurvatus TaxID=90255 RepID=UPI00221F58E4|nr:uncharacterized protein BX663DRAFT_502416 [Cokeromyces recurvatus]KAI7905309.1 hypothetical protein BX663DRAFT_502416 [Cokeromyces recurvatus]